LQRCISEVCDIVVGLQWAQEINHVMWTFRSVSVGNFVGYYVKTSVYLPHKNAHI